MLYIVSGTSRSGKTMIAEKISKQKAISYVSLDWLVMGFTNGIPEYGIHDKLMPDEIALRSWSFIRAMLESMIWCEVDCIIEGEALLPELIIQLSNKHPDSLKICFVGYTDITVEKKVKEIEAFSFRKCDWLIDNPDEYIRAHIQNMIGYSKRIKKSCRENKIRYFDTSKNFMGAIEAAAAYLVSNDENQSM